MKWYSWVLLALLVIGITVFVIIMALSFLSSKLLFKSSAHYAKLTSEELLVLSDEELVVAVTGKFDQKYGLYRDYKKALTNMNDLERTVLSIADFDMETQNGGLCQYFSNSSRYSAPFLLSALDTLGSVRFKEELSRFISENNVDLNNLERFSVDDVNEYIENTKLLPFDDFDSKYQELYQEENLNEILAAFIRTNIDAFD